MDFTYLFYGLGIIALGFLLKIFPILIAGYNTMTKEQKQNVDIKGFSSFLRNVFIVMGLSVIIFCFLLSWNWAFGIIILGGIIYLLIGGQKYNLRNRKKNN
ncbi:MAG: DUF3784 domain-containing protein [Petrimonas sp.]|jgi:type IV secretory pathway TrbL component